MITREFNLYLHAGHSIPLVINANQYDHGEQWLFTLFNSDGTQYVPSSGAIVGIKSDNLGIINSGSVDAQGRVVINETQQMTAAVGKAVFELVIDDGTHGTANFVVLVEPKPGDNADLSETDISMIEQAVEAASTIKPYGSPLVASTVAGMTDHEKVYVYVGSETGYTSGNWYYWDGSAWTSGGVYNSVAVQTDTTLTLSGVAADAKKTGDEISDLKSQIEQNGSFSNDAKIALIACLEGAVFKNGDAEGRGLINTLQAALNVQTLLSITAVFNQGNAYFFDFSDIEELRNYLTVTAHFSDGTSGIVSNYTLSGTLDSAVSTITVTYQEKTATFNVNVTLPVFDYVASRDGLLSEMEGISKFTSNDSEWSESITESGQSLRIAGTGGDSSYLQFKIGETPSTGNWRMLIDAELYKAQKYGNTGCGNIRPQLSNGTSGVKFGEASSTNGATSGTVTVRAFLGSTVNEIGTMTIGNDQWHLFHLYMDDSEPVQQISIDGVELLNTATLATVGNNSVIFTGSCIAFVKSIKLYNH